jgi:hypothetical protein
MPVGCFSVAGIRPEWRVPSSAEEPKSYRGAFSTSLGAGLRKGDRRGRDYGEQNINE